MSMTASSLPPDVSVRWQVLRELVERAPFQPATNYWRAIEVPELAAALPKQGRGLDVGCGDGALTAVLRRLVGDEWTLVGIDVHPFETALARQSGEYAAVHTCGADNVPEPSESFDFAFANSVLEHIPDLPSCLREIARLLRPGGLLVATVPAATFHSCLSGRAGERRDAYLDTLDRRLAHVNYWSIERWHNELAACGLELTIGRGYLSCSQVRWWESWSNWTGGLFYRISGRRHRPIESQRALGLRRGLPMALRFIAAPIAWIVARGGLGGAVTEAEPTGGLLVAARKRKD